MAKEPSLPYYLPLADEGEEMDSYLSQAQRKTKTAWSMI